MDPELATLIRQAGDGARQRAGAWDSLRAHPDDVRRRVQFEMWERIEFERREAVAKLRARLGGRGAGA